jgi:hypothetical protein
VTGHHAIFFKRGSIILCKGEFQKCTLAYVIAVVPEMQEFNALRDWFLNVVSCFFVYIIRYIMVVTNKMTSTSQSDQKH